MATEAKLLTADEFGRLPQDEIRWAELVRGEIKRMDPPEVTHGLLQARIASALFSPAEAAGGAAMIGSGFLLATNPDTVRGADVAYVSPERFPKQDFETFWPGAPDLVIEIVSPSDLAEDLQAKILDYLSARAQWLWIAYPKLRSVVAWYSDGHGRVYRIGDTLEAGDVLPGFALPVAEVFRKPGA